MLLNDYHIHSHFSGDSQEHIDKIINKCISLGMKDMAITDHLEYDIDGMTPNWEINLDEYTKTILAYKEKYKDLIDISLGIEVGVQPHTRKFLEEQINKYPFDFIIISTHALDRQDIAMSRIYDKMTKQELQKYYFETVLDNVKNYNDFNVYGHIDFITRYGGEDFHGVNYEENKDLIDEILKTLIMKNKGIEINTSGFRYNEDRVYPCDYILKRYIELGGQIITLGSDAHISDYIGMDFPFVYEKLRKMGVNYICSFKNREPIFRKI